MRTIKINETGEVFSSIAECAKKLEIAPQSVSAALAGTTKSAAGFTFSYLGQGRKVAELISGRTFDSAATAIRELGIDKSHAYKMLRGERSRLGSIVLSWIS